MNKILGDVLGFEAVEEDKEDKKEATENKKKASEDKKKASEDKKEASEDKKKASEDKKEASEDKKEAIEDRKEATEDKKEVTEDKKTEREKTEERCEGEAIEPASTKGKQTGLVELFLAWFNAGTVPVSGTSLVDPLHRKNILKPWFQHFF